MIRGRRPFFSGPITGLCHRPEDRDDPFDLGTIWALPQLGLLGVVLDTMEEFLKAGPNGWGIPRDPGDTIVGQAAAVTGGAIPVARGSGSP